MSLSQTSTYNLSLTGEFLKIEFVSEPILKTIYLHVTSIQFSKYTADLYKVCSFDSLITILDYTKCLNEGVGLTTIEDFLDFITGFIIVPAGAGDPGGGGESDINLVSLDGVTVSVNSGTIDDGTQRVTLATDDPLTVETQNIGVTTSSMLVALENSLRSGSDLGLVRYLIDIGAPEFSNYKYENISMDGSSLTVSNSPATTTERTAGLPATSPFDRVHFPALGTGTALHIASTSANDISGGSGARNVYIYGLDNTWNEIEEEVVLNGNTVVTTTATNFIRVNRMVVSSVGASGTNEGDIFLSSDSSFTSGIPNINVVCAIQINYGKSVLGVASTALTERLYWTRGSYYTDTSSSKALKNSQYRTAPWDLGSPNTNRITCNYGNLWVSNTTSFNTSGEDYVNPCTDIEFTVVTSATFVNYSIIWNTVRIKNALFT